MNSKELFEYFMKLLGGLIFAKGNAAAAGNHPRESPAFGGTIEAEYGFAPFGRFADFIPNAEARRCDFGDESV